MKSAAYSRARETCNGYICTCVDRNNRRRDFLYFCAPPCFHGVREYSSLRCISVLHNRSGTDFYVIPRFSFCRLPVWNVRIVFVQGDKKGIYPKLQYCTVYGDIAGSRSRRPWRIFRRFLKIWKALVPSFPNIQEFFENSSRLPRTVPRGN